MIRIIERRDIDLYQIFYELWTPIWTPIPNIYHLNSSQDFVTNCNHERILAGDGGFEPPTPGSGEQNRPFCNFLKSFHNLHNLVRSLRNYYAVITF